MSSPDFMEPTTEQERARSKRPPSFFVRDPDGTVRVRIRLTADEASRIEEAAGTTPLLSWMHRTLNEVAAQRVAENSGATAGIGPPREGSE